MAASRLWTSLCSLEPSITWSRASVAAKEVRPRPPSGRTALFFCGVTAGCLSGFGSMLRALGAQIEKTTNREACRDLSGRRLRDVNHEKE